VLIEPHRPIPKRVGRLLDESSAGASPISSERVLRCEGLRGGLRGRAGARREHAATRPEQCNTRERTLHLALIVPSLKWTADVLCNGLAAIRETVRMQREDGNEARQFTVG